MELVEYYKVTGKLYWLDVSSYMVLQQWRRLNGYIPSSGLYGGPGKGIDWTVGLELMSVYWR